MMAKGCGDRSWRIAADATAAQPIASRPWRDELQWDRNNLRDFTAKKFTAVPAAQRELVIFVTCCISLVRGRRKSSRLRTGDETAA